MTDHILGDDHAASCREPATRLRGVARGAIALAAAALILGGCVAEVPVGSSASVGAAPGYGYTCYAGVYVCHTPQQVLLNSPCSCPGIGAPSFGRVH